MADEILSRDQNFITVLAGVTDDTDKDIRMLRVDPISKRLLIKADISGLDSIYLKLDQTSPQTIINGQPIQDVLTASSLVMTDGNKKLSSIANNSASIQKVLSQTASGVPFWDIVPSAGQLIYYLHSTNSSISTYLQQLVAPQAGAITLNTTVNSGTNVVLRNFATDAGFPNLSFIPAGIYTVHIHASSTNPNTVDVYAEIWEVSATGVDIAKIGTTETTATQGGLTTSDTEYELKFANANVYTMGSTASRIVTRMFALRASNNHVVSLYVGNLDDSHTALPSNTVDATNFVPYVGATQDVVLDGHGLSASSLTDTGLTMDRVTVAGVGGLLSDDGEFNFSPDTKTLFVGTILTGIELITNGTFTGSISPWTAGTGWSYGSNNALYSGTGATLLSQAVNIGSVGWYQYKYTISNYTGDQNHYFKGGTMQGSLHMGNGTFTGYIYYTSTSSGNTNAIGSANGSASTWTVDDVSLHKVTQDGNAFSGIFTKLITATEVDAVTIKQNGNTVIDSSTIGAQSVAFATNATNASFATNAGAATFATSAGSVPNTVMISGGPANNMVSYQYDPNNGSTSILIPAAASVYSVNYTYAVNDNTIDNSRAIYTTSSAGIYGTALDFIFPAGANSGDLLNVVVIFSV